MQRQAEFESIVAKVRPNAGFEQDAEQVRAKYGPMFTPAGISELDPEKFRAFLRFDENHHWTGINRWSGKLTADLPLLKKALLVLVDETKPISARIDEARRTIGGLGRAAISAILQVAYPTKYGVYNTVSGDALKQLGLHPRKSVSGFDSLSLGKRYEYANRVLLDLAKQYDISLWTLDFVLGVLVHQKGSEAQVLAHEIPAPGEEAIPGGAVVNRFGLERQLEAFLVENWDKTPLAAFLDILVDEDGDAIGEQYSTDVGPIDLLCKHKDGSGYTVVELKRGQTNDDTVGQVAGYMGWIKKNLVKDNQSVRGLIICLDADEKLMTALTVVPNIDVFTYTVSFAISKKG